MPTTPLIARWPNLTPLNIGLLFLRVKASTLLLVVHGLPKLTNFHDELQHIDDPLGIGRGLTLCLAILAEVVCPLLIIAGGFTRLACLPIIILLLVSMLLIHPQWTLLEGQFGWLLLIIFITLALTGPGLLSLDGQVIHPLRRRSSDKT